MNMANIILIEDDDAVRHSLKMLLMLANQEVRDFARGDLALSERPFDPEALLIVDYLLPDTDGLKLITDFKSKGWHGSAILVTGYFDETLNARALHAGYHAVYEKPFHYPDVLGAVVSLTTMQ
jgi:FixJ family two-component response regulator